MATRERVTGRRACPKKLAARFMLENATRLIVAASKIAAREPATPPINCARAVGLSAAEWLSRSHDERRASNVAATTDWANRLATPTPAMPITGMSAALPPIMPNETAAKIFDAVWVRRRLRAALTAVSVTRAGMAARASRRSNVVAC
jgi:hypothetical protein